MQSLNDTAMSIADFFTAGPGLAMGALLFFIVFVLQKPIFETIFGLCGVKTEDDLLKWSDFVRHKKLWLSLGALFAFGLLLFGLAEAIDLWKRFTG